MIIVCLYTLNKLLLLFKLVFFYLRFKHNKIPNDFEWDINW